MPVLIDWTEIGGRGSLETFVLRVLKAVMVTAALLTLWSLTHHYRGLSGDGGLYALQALAKIIPTLGTDVFLQGASQDNYTVFSPFYALFIGWFGLRTAAFSLMIFFKLCFYGSSWAFLGTLTTPRHVLLGIALLIVLGGGYGAFSVFQYGEDFLTARTAAEALIIAALALHFRGHRVLAALFALTALVIHPVMALPGLILLLFISVPMKWRALVAGTSILAALAIACYGSANGSSTGVFAILDLSWLEVVRERSQFLFLQLWSTTDWIGNSRPFVSLLVTMLATSDIRMRQLSGSCLLLGVSGLLIAFIAGTIGPVAVLLQGQAWRWLWIPAYLSAVLLVPTGVNMLRDENSGLICALFFFLGWSLPPTIGLGCLTAALLIWSGRNRSRAQASRFGRGSVFIVAIVALLWIAKCIWDTHGIQSSESGLLDRALADIRSALVVQSAAVLLGWAIYKWVVTSRSAVAMLLCTATFTATAAISLPGAIVRASSGDANSAIDNFQDWRAAIPPRSNVYITPESNSAAFAWFTLQRPSYLSLDQSSGVVFSRETALEIKRRSQILLPVSPVDWQLLSAIENRHRGVPKKDGSKTPITSESLTAICGDPKLGFVVTQRELGFAPLKHLHEGPWKNWNLYDCDRVRASLAAM